MESVSDQRRYPSTKKHLHMHNNSVLVAVLVAGIINWRPSSAFQSLPINHASLLDSRQPSIFRHHHLLSCSSKNPPFTRIESSLQAGDARNSDGDEAAFVSSFLYEGTFQGMDEGMLAYLPDGGKNIPPRMRRLIQKVTSEYVHGVNRRPQVGLADVLDVIDTEYESLSPSVSFKVGNQTFEEPRIVQIVSLAVLHQLPKEITLQLFSAANDDNQAVVDFRSAFQDGGWEQVSFPQGLGIRIKKRLQFNPNQPFFPPSKLPWRTRSKRKAAVAATRGILKAAETQAPEQNVMTKEEFLAEIENEMQAAPLSGLPVNEPTDSIGGTLTRDGALPSFPAERYSMAWTKVKRIFMDPSKPLTNNKTLKKILAVAQTQYNKLKQAGRAGIMSYAFINFVLYTVGMVWQWRRIAVAVPVPDGATLVSLTIRKFMKAFTRVYAGAAVFKIFRIVAALALAPAAGRVLAFTQRKLRVSENTAFVILVTLLLKTFLGTLAVVFLGDSALRKAIPVVYPLTTPTLTCA